MTMSVRKQSGSGLEDPSFGELISAVLRLSPRHLASNLSWTRLWRGRIRRALPVRGALRRDGATYPVFLNLALKLHTTRTTLPFEFSSNKFASLCPFGSRSKKTLEMEAKSPHNHI